MNDREYLIKQLKEKILKEISDRKDRLSKELLLVEPNLLITEEYEDLLREIIFCADVANFINQKKRFMQILNQIGDKIIYAIPDKTIRMWLLDDFNWLHNFSSMLINKDAKENPFFFVSERDLGLGLMSIFEEIILEKKLNLTN